jgi:hypothetical protein
MVTPSRLPLRAVLIVLACHAACSVPPTAPPSAATASHAAPPAEPARCRGDDDCVLSPVDCSECGRCPGDEPSAVLRTEIGALQADCARHPPVRLDPHAAALGLRPPACAPCPLGLNEPRPLWRAICRDGGCGVEPAGTEQPFAGSDLIQSSAPTAKARALEPPDTSCAVDSECVILTAEIEEGLPGTHACCPGCKAHAVNRDWAARFQSGCEAAPPPACPPIGCPLPLLRAACKEGQCASAQ